MKGINCNKNFLDDNNFLTMYSDCIFFDLDSSEIYCKPEDAKTLVKS